MQKVFLDKVTLQKIIEDIKEIKICIIGDICLDIYWFGDMKLSRLSRETPHHPLPIVREKYSLGGAGNVIANIAALGVKKLIPISIIGEDWRGSLVNSSLVNLGIDTEHLYISKSRLTPAYCKPIRKGISELEYEDPRLDFENYDSPDKYEEENILDSLRRVNEYVDIIAISDQYGRGGIITPRIKNELSRLGKSGKVVVVDSRERIMNYENAIIVPNEIEANSESQKEGQINFEEYVEIGKKLYKRNNYPVIITLGGEGALWIDDEVGYHAPAEKMEPPIDIVGAGDTFLSAFCCAYATGLDGPKALAFANLASSVILKKINTTGTASPEEILNKYTEIYR